MKIVIDNKLTYSTADFSVGLGDTVILPPTRWMKDNWLGKVTHLNSSYTGPTKDIVGVAEYAKGTTKQSLLSGVKKRVSLISAMEQHCVAKKAANFAPKQDKAVYSWKDVLYVNGNAARTGVTITSRCGARSLATLAGYKFFVWSGVVYDTARDVDVGLVSEVV